MSMPESGGAVMSAASSTPGALRRRSSTGPYAVTATETGACSVSVETAMLEKPAASAGITVKSGDALGGKAEVGVLQIPERVKEQSGRNQQQRGKRDLTDHQRMGEPVRDAARAQPARCCLQGALRMSARHKHRRKYRREQGRNRSDGGQHQDHRPVERDRLRARNRVGRKGTDGSDQQPCEGNAERRIRAPTSSPPSTSMPRMRRPRGAPMRGAHSKLLLPAQAARDHQIGDIRARDQKHHAQSRDQPQKDRTHLPGDRLEIGNRLQLEVGVQLLRIRRLHAASRAVKFRLRLCAA